MILSHYDKPLDDESAYDIHSKIESDKQHCNDNDYQFHPIWD
jgi:hypothetical protein